MLFLKEVKNDKIAGPAIKSFDFFIQWHLTERCNLRCRHCYQEATPTEELNAEEVKHEIDGAAEMFEAWEKEQDVSVSPSIHFTGGEPLLHAGLWNILAYAAAKGFRTALLSNGTLINEENARKISELGVCDTQVSLEGPPEIHDSIRGTGSFAAAARGIEFLTKTGNMVSANVTLSRLNVDKIEETAGLASEMGCYGIGFSRLVPCGSAKEMFANLLTAAEIREAYARIIAMNTPDFEVSSSDPLAGILAGNAPSRACGLSMSGCSAAFFGVTIASDGAVMPCRRMNIKVGNLKDNSLRSIWATSPILWKLRKRENYRGACGSCSFWPVCRGCRAVAYACSQAQGKPDLFADDPQCWLAPS
jgi:AdoMet-dependent heme synthase